MNTNNVYFADIRRIVSGKYYGDSIWNAGVKFETVFLRQSLVLYKGDNKCIDLLGKGKIPIGKNYLSDIGTEYIDPYSFIPFNEVVNQYRRSLPKCLIRRIGTQYLYSNKK